MTAAGERLIAAAKEMRTMAKIPEDIIKAGRRCYDGLGRGSVSDSEHIAIALLAAEKRGEERERESAARTGYRICAETRHVTLGDKVAAAIRKGSD